MCVNPLIARDQPRDAHRGFLNLRRQATHRASCRGPAQHSAQCRSVDGAGQRIQRFERHRRLGERLGDARVQPVTVSQSAIASSRSACSDRRTDAALGVARQDCGPHRPRPIARRPVAPRPARAPPARVRRAASPSTAAPRSMADAGLFSSCASPADSLPSDTIFSSCSSLDVNARARSTMVCTRIDVISGHSRITRALLAGHRQDVARFLGENIGGRADEARVGSIPVTSPWRHSMTRWGPEPRSRESRCIPTVQ